MRRANRALSEEEIRDVLRTAKRGVLAMTGDGGRPYCVYVNPFYDEDTGRLYVHGGKAGAAVLVFALVPEHVTGKRVHEA